jgi:hypothetical protein
MISEILKASVEIDAKRMSGRIIWLIQGSKEYQSWLWYGEISFCIIGHK